MKSFNRTRRNAPRRPRAAAGRDAELIKLGHTLTAAATAAEAFWKAVEQDKSDAAYDAAEAAHERAATVVRKIESIRALTPAGVQVKLQALIWCRNGELVEDVRSELSGTTDMGLLVGLAADLAAMAKA